MIHVCMSFFQGIKKKGAHNETKLDKMLYALFRKDV